MKENITDQPLETKVTLEGACAEVELTKINLEGLDEAEGNAALMNKIRAEFMKRCAAPNEEFINTEGLSKPKALVGCAMEWKNNMIKQPVSKALTNNLFAQTIKSALSPQELKALTTYANQGEALPKALKGIINAKAEIETTSNWEKVESADREEYSTAKTKKQWEKIDKKELDRDTKKEKEEHEKDAVDDDDSKIKKLKKGKPSEKKEVEIHDLKKDQELDREDKTKYSKADLPPWLKDKKELKKDSKKEKEEHEKDAIKDDKKQVKDLKKDEKEDEKSEKKDKKSKASDYSKYWDYAAERFDGKKRSELKDSAFLDPKRRSFPVVNCKNVRAAVSTWGMYKGSMSFEEFKRKLTSRAKSLGCEGSLPKSWSNKKDK